jgi:MFS superfamily sulfate permease-like transporter
LGILNGLLLAIALSLILLLRQLASARLSVLGRLADGHDFVDIAQHADALPPPGLLILRPEEPLFFVNAEAVMTLARRQVMQHADVQHVILSLEASPDLDGTALESLGDFSGWLQARGVGLRVARLKDETRALLRRAALPQLSPQAVNNWSVEDAVSASIDTPSATGNKTQ